MDFLFLEPGDGKKSADHRIEEIYLTSDVIESRFVISAFEGTIDFRVNDHKRGFEFMCGIRTELSEYFRLWLYLLESVGKRFRNDNKFIILRTGERKIRYGRTHPKTTNISDNFWKGTKGIAREEDGSTRDNDEENGDE
ncbi:MAG: hypothetical protein ACD_78C00188G0003 [uncultured bacterium (gcode 4)]|uniref:Uncharacterized protein n=1 Tax=uncultured bacterium (gcode 4) TaxID=1234023 RepID=K1YCI8_9BACT|nr:MAG: hypothetical protein ACD_78C00188G0003 [uncultured bacterium (gcode 4)]